MKGTRASLSTPKPDMKKHRQGSKRRSLFDTSRMKPFRGKNINFDESLKRGETQTNDNGRPTKIRFFDVEVREYEITASDNPGVKKGVALEVSKTRSRLCNIQKRCMLIHPNLARCSYFIWFRLLPPNKVGLELPCTRT